MILDKLDQDITFESFTGRGRNGQPSYSPSVVLKGFAYGDHRLIRTQDGTTITSNKTVLLIYEDVLPKVQDRITLPTGEIVIVYDSNILPHKKYKIAQLGV